MNSQKKYTQEMEEVSSETITREHEEIKDSPFMAINVGDKFFVGLGNYRLSDDLTSFEECHEWAKNITWNKLTNVMMALIHKNNDVNFNELLNKKEL